MDRVEPALPATAAKDDGDRAARFRAVFEAELDYVWTSLRRLGVRDRDLEDVAHDVFIEVYRRIDVYDPSRPVRPWLFAFAFRVASDWRRRAHVRNETLDDRVEAVERVDPALSLDRAQQRALVLRAIDAIDIDRRGVFILYELDEVPMKEIAESLGIPLHTAYSRLRVAREEFAAAVKRASRARGER
jgi:RNA polymerase sigma-70 factor (ECF subfamily)